jgi:hypothetical protein
MTIIMKLNKEISIEVHGKKNVYVKYNNMVDQVEATITKFGTLLEEDYKLKQIVEISVKYNHLFAQTQKDAVIQFSVVHHSHMYQISHADRPCQVLGNFLGNIDYTPLPTWTSAMA